MKGVMLRAGSIATIVLSAVLLSGCLDVERFVIRYNINRDLQGTVALEFVGIHSSSEKPSEQKEEMREFYEAGYQEEAARMEREWSIVNAKAELSQKTDLRCDGKLSGEMEDLLRSLGPLLQEQGAEYEVRRGVDRFSFTARGGWDANDDNIVLVIRYEGKILEHNAPKYNESLHEMEWNLGRLDESGIHFVLAVKE